MAFPDFSRGLSLSLFRTFVSARSTRPLFLKCNAALLLLLTLSLARPHWAVADSELKTPELGEEYTGYAKTRAKGGRSSNSGQSLALAILLYIPNRVVDLIDIFRLDVGVGPANGAVLRVTDGGQVGARYMSPGSLRVGLFGRNWPVKLEKHDEYGIGPGFLRSKDRRTGDYELGFGGDLLLVGAYGGVRFDEIMDFFTGLVGYDLLDDDF